MRPHAALSGAFLLAITIAVPHDTDACIHPDAGPRSARVSLPAGAYQALAIPGRGVQHLIISTGLAPGQTARRLAWLIPVPTTPSAYKTADPALFSDLASATGLTLHTPRRRYKSARGAKSAGGGGTTALRALPTTQAGPYTIHPLKARGAKGVRALKLWMNRNRFTPPSTKLLAHYARQGWTFLAVEVKPPAMMDSISAGDLPPLHLTFRRRGGSMVFPLKIMAGSGSFPVRLHVVTPGLWTDNTRRQVARYGLHAAHTTQRGAARGCTAGTYTVQRNALTMGAMPESLRALVASVHKRWPHQKGAYVNVLYTPDSRCLRLASKPRDLTVPLRYRKGTGELGGGGGKGGLVIEEINTTRPPKKPTRKHIRRPPHIDPSMIRKLD